MYGFDLLNAEQLMIIKRWSGTFSKCRGRSKTRFWHTQLRVRSTRSSGRQRSRTGSPSATTTASRYCASECASERNKDRDLLLSAISRLSRSVVTDVGVTSSRLTVLIRQLVLVFGIVVLALSAFFVWPKSYFVQSFSPLFCSAACSCLVAVERARSKEARSVFAVQFFFCNPFVVSLQSDLRIHWFQTFCRSFLTL